MERNISIAIFMVLACPAFGTRRMLPKKFEDTSIQDADYTAKAIDSPQEISS